MQPTPTLELRVSDSGGVTTVAVSGDVDADNAGSLLACLREVASVPARRIAVDLGDVGFLDSTAMSVLIQAQVLAEGRRSVLRVTAASSPVRRALELAGLSEHLLG